MRRIVKMTKKLFSLLVFINITFLIYSQTDGPKTVFWEISGNGLMKSSYLFGTIHVMPKDEFVSFDIADQKLEESDQLVLEMEIDVPLKTQLEWARQIMLPDGENLSSYMDEEEFQRIKAYAVDSLGVKEMMFNNYLKLKPFAFYSALIPNIIGTKIEGYDLYYSKLAKKHEIPVTPLESFEFQIGIFDSIPMERQIDMFFDEEVDMKSSLLEILDLYRDQDIYSMPEMFKEEDSEYEEFEFALLIDRNTRWAEVLDTLMQENSSFIAVGAAHLAGSHGLIKLLREKGYRVEPIMLKEEE